MDLYIGNKGHANTILMAYVINYTLYFNILMFAKSYIKLLNLLENVHFLYTAVND
jgi:hypothetical protein